MLDEDEVPTKVVCGFQHACCLCESGRAYAWGKANHGQLGRGDVDLSFKPLMVFLFLHSPSQMDTDASVHYRDIYAGFNSSIVRTQMDSELQLISNEGDLYITGKYWGTGQNKKNAKMYGNTVRGRDISLIVDLSN